MKAVKTGVAFLRLLGAPALSRQMDEEASPLDALGGMVYNEEVCARDIIPPAAVCVADMQATLLTGGHGDRSA